MKRYLAALVVIAGLSLSGCVALLAGGAGGATALACTEDELNCPVD